MNRRLLALMLAISLLCTLNSPAAAGVLGYSMRGAEKGFKDKPAPEPSAAVLTFDTVLTRPVTGALTIGGTALFLLALPFSVPSGSVESSARALIVKPGGYTFVRPLGREDERFMEKGLFPQTLGSGDDYYRR
jgi:hypothetical protein